MSGYIVPGSPNDPNRNARARAANEERQRIANAERNRRNAESRAQVRGAYNSVVSWVDSLLPDAETDAQAMARRRRERDANRAEEARVLAARGAAARERAIANTPTAEERAYNDARNTRVDRLTPEQRRLIRQGRPDSPAARTSAAAPVAAATTAGRATTGRSTRTSTARSTNAERSSRASSSSNTAPVSAPQIAPSDQQQPQLELNTNLRNRNIVEPTSTSQVFDINSFRSEIITNDVLPAHAFLVTFSPFRSGFPENTPLNNFVTNKRNTLVMRCESVTIPTPTLLKEDDIRRYGYGPVEKVGYGVQFGDISMTWIVDNKSELVNFMHQWMNTIVSHDSPNTNMAQSFDYRDGLAGYSPFEVGYKDAYSNPIVRVYVYNRQNQTVAEYEMYDVFPQNIQTINMAWANENEIQKLNVTFSYTSMRMKAPLKTTEEQLNYLLEGRINPYEERIQTEDRGGRAASDRSNSPIEEVITSTANATMPNANEPQLTLNTVGSATPQTVVRTLNA